MSSLLAKCNHLWLSLPEICRFWPTCQVLPLILFSFCTLFMLSTLFGYRADVSSVSIFDENSVSFFVRAYARFPMHELMTKWNFAFFLLPYSIFVSSFLSFLFLMPFVSAASLVYATLRWTLRSMCVTQLQRSWRTYVFFLLPFCYDSTHLLRDDKLLFSVHRSQTTINVSWLYRSLLFFIFILLFTVTSKWFDIMFEEWSCIDVTDHAGPCRLGPARTCAGQRGLMTTRTSGGRCFLSSPIRPNPVADLPSSPVNLPFSTFHYSNFSFYVLSSSLFANQTFSFLFDPVSCISELERSAFYLPRCQILCLTFALSISRIEPASSVFCTLRYSRHSRFATRSKL